jgi:hypothetical protein
MNSLSKLIKAGGLILNVSDDSPVAFLSVGPGKFPHLPQQLRYFRLRIKGM